MACRRGLLGAILGLMICLSIRDVFGRKHSLDLQGETRPIIHISQFGFFRGGYLLVKLHGLRVDGPSANVDNKIGFTVDRTLSDGINPYPPHTADRNCPLNRDDESMNADGVQRIAFSLDFTANTVRVACSRNLDSIQLYPDASSIPEFPEYTNHRQNTQVHNGMIQQRRKRETEGMKSGQEIPNEDETNIAVPGVGGQDSNAGARPSNSISTQAPKKDEILPADELPLPVVSRTPKKSLQADGEDEVKEAGDGNVREVQLDENPVVLPVKPVSSRATPPSSTKCEGHEFPLSHTNLSDKTLSYSTQFLVYVATEESQGLYNLYFHHCGEEWLTDEVALNLSIIEQNRGRNYLSAGEMPLPALYFMMSILFFISGCFWVFILKKSRKETGVAVFKIHYLMGALVYLKSLSLLFHAINFHFIEVLGTHVEGWAVLYYITHLLKGAFLFIVILLIGTGYAFVKHLLSDKDKKIFMIVIPLQVLANVAEIIIEESEEGEMVHTTWKVIFISLDLLCCGAILFPVVWSIRHLQEASQTDGKAATNLRKLKLFRHFYMIVVCYIYFTRIIVNMLLRITVPFQYTWLDEMFREMTTFIFFVLTGYKFRPARNNPYLALAHDSDDEAEMDISITESGLTAGLNKRGPNARKKTLKEMVIFDPNEEETDDDEEVLLEKKQESSHDYD